MPLLPHAEQSCLSLETLDMKSAAMNRVLGDLTSAQSNPSSEAGAYAWLNLPAVSSVAVTPDSNRELLDEVDRLIASYSEFPHGYPENKKTDEHRIRIHYRHTNNKQASASFTNILENYRSHVLYKTLLPSLSSFAPPDHVRVVPCCKFDRLGCSCGRLR